VVASGGSAWESNPPVPWIPRDPDGVEDRGRHQPPSASGGIVSGVEGPLARFVEGPALWGSDCVS